MGRWKLPRGNCLGSEWAHQIWNQGRLDASPSTASAIPHAGHQVPCQMHLGRIAEGIQATSSRKNTSLPASLRPHEPLSFHAPNSSFVLWTRPGAQPSPSTALLRVRVPVALLSPRSTEALLSSVSPCPPGLGAALHSPCPTQGSTLAKQVSGRRGHGLAMPQDSPGSLSSAAPVAPALWHGGVLSGTQS